MTNSDRLRRQLVKIYILTNLQRALRLGLRAAWMGAAGVMLGWGVNAVWGWLPNLWSWLLIGLVFALIPFSGIVAFFTMPSRWIWAMDQHMGQRGQLSTALESARIVSRRQNSRPGRFMSGEPVSAATVEDLLIADALDLLPKVRKRALQTGLFHEIDLAAVMILTVLAFAVLASLLIHPQPAPASQTGKSSSSNLIIPLTAFTPTPDQLPGDQQQPAGQSPQTGQAGAGSQGQQGQAGNDQGNNNNGSSQGDQSQRNSGDSQNQGANALPDALRQLGSQLSKQAGTYSLGQSLENMDLNGAAQALEDLSSQLNNLSPESQNNLSQAMQDAANSLSENTQSQDGGAASALTNDLGNAASALSGANQDAAGALGQVANDLRQLSGEMQASQGSGSSAGSGKSSQTGNPEPLSRLPNENGDFSLPVDGAAQPGLLNPGPPDSADTASGSAAGSLDSTYQAGGNPSQVPILPNTFSWKWRNVVSQYFQR